MFTWTVGDILAVWLGAIFLFVAGMIVVSLVDEWLRKRRIRKGNKS